MNRKYERKLRERARSILEKTSPADATSMPEQDLKLIVEELETFRIELDLQSEELQKRNEEFLASEKRYADLFNLAPVGYLILNESLRIIQANLAAADMLGQEAKGLSGVSLSRFVHSESQDELYFHKNRLVEGVCGDSCELRLLRGEGRNFLAAVNSRCLDDKGEGASFVMSITDLSNRQTVEEKLRQALAEKDILISEIHHRVNNNLNVIHSLIGLESSTSSDQVCISALNKCNSRVRAMSHIYKLIYRQGDLARIDLSEYVKTLIQEVSRRYDPENRRIEFALSVDIISLNYDTIIPVGLILNELIRNAFIHAFDDEMSGRIDISVSEEVSHNFLSVSDSGKGMGAQFDLQSVTSGGYMVVRTLCDQIGADLRISGEDGTTVDISFPGGTL